MAGPTSFHLEYNQWGRNPQKEGIMPRKIGPNERTYLAKQFQHRQFIKVARKIAHWADKSGYKPTPIAGSESYENLGVNIGQTSVSLYTHSLDDLHQIRAALREIIPNYSDKLESIYPAWWPQDCGTARFETSAPGISIYLTAPIDGFPIKLDEGCGFKQIERMIPAQEAQVEKVWQYSCEGKR